MPPDHNPLQALESVQAPILFKHLPAALDSFYWIFMTIGFLLLAAGHIFRLMECGNNGDRTVREWFKTMVIFAFMVTAPKFVAMGVDGMQALQDASGVGNPATITRKCIKLGLAFPELETVFNQFSKSQQSQAQNGPDPVANALGDGGILGYAKAFGVAVAAEASDLMNNTKRAWNALIDGPALIASLITAGLKAIAVMVTSILLFLFMCGCGVIAWFIDTLRYFLLVTGAMLLPTFIAGYSTKAFSSQAHNYVVGMISIVLWPFGWILGHIGTVGLFNAYVSLVSGASLVEGAATKTSAFVNNMSWDNIDTTISGVSTAAVAGGALAIQGMGVPFLWLAMVVIGGIGLFLWVFIVTVFGPVLVTKLVTTGASFYSGAAGGALKAGASMGGSVMGLAAKTAAGIGVAGAGAAAAGSGTFGGGASGTESAPGPSGSLSGKARAGAMGGGSSGGATTLFEAGVSAAADAAQAGEAAGAAGGAEGFSQAPGGASKSSSGGGARNGGSPKPARGMAGSVQAAVASLRYANPTGLGLAVAASSLKAASHMGDDPGAAGGILGVGGLDDYLGNQNRNRETNGELSESVNQTALQQRMAKALEKLASKS